MGLKIHFYGNGLVIIAYPQLQLTGLSSLVSMPSREQKYYTKQELRANASSLFG
jgi:hypothetical protein